MIDNNTINTLIYFIINTLIIKALSNTFIQFKKHFIQCILIIIFVSQNNGLIFLLLTYVS